MASLVPRCRRRCDDLRPVCVCVWQIFDLRLRRFAEGLEQDHPSLDGSLGQRQRRQAMPQGGGVAGELDALNTRYLALAEELAKALDRQVRSPPRSRVAPLFCPVL